MTVLFSAQNPQEVTFEEPVKRCSWRDTLTVPLVSLIFSYKLPPGPSPKTPHPAAGKWGGGGRFMKTRGFRKAFQPEFGAYRGLARVLESPSNPQNCGKKEKIVEKGTFIFCAKLWYAPNPGSKEI